MPRHAKHRRKMDENARFCFRSTNTARLVFHDKQFLIRAILAILLPFRVDPPGRQFTHSHEQRSGSEQGFRFRIT